MGIAAARPTTGAAVSQGVRERARVGTVKIAAKTDM
jgi:hypothetical protein